MSKHRTKVFLTCMAPKELTEFNRSYNEGIKKYCERSNQFVPDVRCMRHHGEAGLACKYLAVKQYKGDK